MQNDKRNKFLLVRMAYGHGSSQNSVSTVSHFSSFTAFLLIVKKVNRPWNIDESNLVSILVATWNHSVMQLVG